jgi:hypothetical protein
MTNPFEDESASGEATGRGGRRRGRGREHEATNALRTTGVPLVRDHLL